MRWSRNSVGIYFGTISFICLNPLVPDVPNLPSEKPFLGGIKDERQTNGLKETILGGCNKRREMDFFKLLFIF